ncbi:MAG: nucleotidyl transferase AbiEii/AbiGii toxin family protein [Kiloniellales bacterium]
MNNSLLETRWPELLRIALSALDTLPPETRWSWGGGTALSIRLEHRISFDIDIFLSDSTSLRLLSPQRNDVVRRIADNWHEPGHYLKLLCDEGELDFIASGILTSPGTTPWDFEGHRVPLETVAEVIAKKLHYRASRALARDVFDFAAALEFAPQELKDAIRAEPEGARRAADWIRRHISRLAREWPQAVRPTKVGEALLDVDLLAVAAELDG